MVYLHNTSALKQSSKPSSILDGIFGTYIMFSFALYAIVLLPFLAISAVLILWRLFVYPKARNFHARDALILAAHPDDCVIMAGEYGIETLQSGKTVTVVCMTCGDIDANSEYAKTRRSEMLLAWSKAKLPSEKIIFIDAPESAMKGPANQDLNCRNRIEKIITNAILKLPISPVIFLPAAGESHIDHRTLRKLAINAVLASNRQDIEVYESPEYSNHCSLICNPFGVVKNMLQLIRGGRRIARLVNVDTLYPHYATFRLGAWSLPLNVQRLNLKYDMLRSFKSQGGDKMVEYFGRPDVYRRLNVSRECIGDELLPGIELNGIVYSRLTIAFMASLLASFISLVLLQFIY